MHRSHHAAARTAARRRLGGPLRPRPTSLLACLAVALTASPAAAAPASTVLQADPPATVRVAAGRGHVVAMESDPRGGSTLVELVAERAPRVISRFPGDVAWPTVGTDRGGHTVVVLSPCLPAGPATPLPDCNLAVVDLATGTATALPKSKGAYIGDLDGARAVIARRSASAGVRVAATDATGKARSRPLALGRLLLSKRDAGYPAATRFVDSLDLAHGTIAATFLYGMPNGGDGGGSVLARRALSGRGWTELAHSGYGGASGILRVFRGATVTPTGVRAMFDGGDNEESYVARWTMPGRAAREVIVEPTILASAAFDGDHLVTAGASGPGCGDVPPCTVDAYGPLKLG